MSIPYLSFLLGHNMNLCCNLVLNSPRTIAIHWLLVVSASIFKSSCFEIGIAYSSSVLQHNYINLLNLEEDEKNPERKALRGLLLCLLLLLSLFIFCTTKHAHASLLFTWSIAFSCSPFGLPL